MWQSVKLDPAWARDMHVVVKIDRTQKNIHYKVCSFCLITKGLSRSINIELKFSLTAQQLNLVVND